MSSGSVLKIFFDVSAFICEWMIFLKDDNLLYGIHDLIILIFRGMKPKELGPIKLVKLKETA